MNWQIICRKTDDDNVVKMLVKFLNELNIRIAEREVAKQEVIKKNQRI